MKKVLSAVLALIIALGCVTVAYAYNPDDFENKYGGKDVTGEVPVMIDAPVFMLDDCKLIVNGKEITEHIEDVKIYYDGQKSDPTHNVQAQIPFITVIKELGAKVFWLGDNSALIFYNGYFFYLNIKNYVLLTPHPLGLFLVNVFDPPWLVGGVYVSEYTPLKRECIVNSDYSFLYFKLICKHCKIQCDIDLETATININSNCK